MADRSDPFGEYDHLEPVPVEQALAEIREAKKDLEAKAAVYAQAYKDYVSAKEAKEAAVKMLTEKSFLLNKSALVD